MHHRDGKCQSQNVQIFGYVYRNTDGRNRGPVWNTVVPFGRNLYGHPLAGLLWKRLFEKILLKYVWE